MTTDKDLFWKLLEPEYRAVRMFCLRLCGGSRDDGEDLLQDSLMAAYTKLGSLREKSAFRAWLYRIVVNNYKSRARKPWWQRRDNLTTEISESLGVTNPLSLYTARRRLEQAMRVLTPDERALVTLFELEGWPVAKLSVLFGKKEGNIKVMLMRTRRKMREALAKFLKASAKEKKALTLETGDSLCVAAKPGENLNN